MTEKMQNTINGMKLDREAELKALSEKYGIGLYELMTGQYDQEAYENMEAETEIIEAKYQQIMTIIING